MKGIAPTLVPFMTEIGFGQSPFPFEVFVGLGDFPADACLRPLLTPTSLPDQPNSFYDTSFIRKFEKYFFEWMAAAGVSQYVETLLWL
jgi:hypothetical protein